MRCTWLADWQGLEGVHSPHDLGCENNAQAGLLMQMFITYAQGQRADSNHPPAQTCRTPVSRTSGAVQPADAKHKQNASAGKMQHDTPTKRIAKSTGWSFWASKLAATRRHTRARTRTNTAISHSQAPLRNTQGEKHRSGDRKHAATAPEKRSPSSSNNAETPRGSKERQAAEATACATRGQGFPQSTKKTTPARAEAARQPVTSRRDQGRAEDCVHNVRPCDGAHGGAARRFQPEPSDGDATRAPPHDRPATSRKPATSCRRSAFSVGMNIVASDLTHGGSVFDNLLLESSGDDEESILCRNLIRRMIELGVLAHRFRRHQPT